MAIRVQALEQTASSPVCLSGNLGWLLDQAQHTLASELAAALEPLGLASRDYCVLAAAREEDRTQIELANLVGLDKTTMTVTVDRLERAGLARRTPLSGDRRVRVITVTPAGERRVAKARGVIEQVQSDVLARLPAGQRDALMAGLVSLVSDASPCVAPGPSSS
jgi:DNA-binding MarR family transcriptional regulator